MREEREREGEGGSEDGKRRGRKSKKKGESDLQVRYTGEAFLIQTPKCSHSCRCKNVLMNMLTRVGDQRHSLLRR